MNNKKLGTEFEQEVCAVLCHKNFWAHFITPDKAGAQPFDVIAVKSGIAYAIDCKTCATNKFSISRLEENQKSAFERWLYCGNNMPLVAVQYNNGIVWISYEALKEHKLVPLDIEKINEDIRFVRMYDDLLGDYIVWSL